METPEKINLQVKEAQEKLYHLNHLIQEAEKKERVSSVKSTEMADKLQELVNGFNENEQRLKLQASKVLEEANVKSGEAEKRLADVKFKEKTLDEKLKEHHDLSLSLANRASELLKKEIEFKKYHDGHRLDLELKEKDIIEKTNQNISRLSIENSRNEFLVKELVVQNESLDKRQLGISKTLEEINVKKEIAEKNFNESVKNNDETLKLYKKYEEAEVKLKLAVEKLALTEKTLNEKAKSLADQGYELELKRREVNALETKVKRLIEVHKLEEEARV